MIFHPDTVMALANEHRRDLIAEADKQRLLNVARRARRENEAAARGRGAITVAPRRRDAGNLATCGPREAAPAR